MTNTIWWVAKTNKTQTHS